MQFRLNQRKLDMVIHDEQIVKLLITQGALERISDSQKEEHSLSSREISKLNFN